MTSGRRPLPLRAMTRGLAEMQTSLMATALPLFGGRVDRFMVYTLLARRMAGSGRPTSVLSIANSLRLPFETTRRHIGALIEAGLCRRDLRGVELAGTIDDPPLSSLAPLAHDCLVRFIDDLAAVDALPRFVGSERTYSWLNGWCAAADLMLAVADTNRATHHDRIDLVLFSTILCANGRAVSEDPVLARRHADLTSPPPVVRPLRPRLLAERLGMSDATVRRRLDRLYEGPVRQGAEGLVIDEAWMVAPDAVATSTATWGNVRRLLTALATLGFPFDEPARAYLVGRPPPVSFD